MRSAHLRFCLPHPLFSSPQLVLQLSHLKGRVRHKGVVKRKVKRWGEEMGAQQLNSTTWWGKQQAEGGQGKVGVKVKR